jgi:Na+/melibiose symporter-like transporter
MVNVAAFFAPISMWAVAKYDVVPTMRVLYIFAFVSMSTKFITLYIFSRETENGKKRLAATKGKSILTMLYECKDVYLGIIRERRTLITMAILAASALIGTLNDNYWANFVAIELGVKESYLSLFMMVKCAVTLVAVLFLTPIAQRYPIKKPIAVTCALFALSQGLLLVLGQLRISGVIWLILIVGIEATAMAIMNPMISALLYFNSAVDERARVYGLINATVSLMAVIFPYLVGRLANISLNYPFIVNIGLAAVIAILASQVTKHMKPVSKQK